MMEKDCASLRELIWADIDKELSPEGQLELNMHLAICPDCREYRDEAQVLSVQLESCMLTDPPADLVAPVWAEIARRRNLRLARAVAITVGVMAFLGFSSGIILLWALKTLNLTWIPNLLSSFWNMIKVLGDSWLTVSEHLLDSYWLSLSVLTAINLAMLLRVIGFKSIKGGNA